MAEGICTITLQRSDVLNAFNNTLTDELSLSLKQASKDKNVRVVVITGSGRAFSSGQDLGDLKDLGLVALNAHIRLGCAGAHDEGHERHQAADQDDHHPLLKYFRLHTLLLTDIEECARAGRARKRRSIRPWSCSAPSGVGR